MEKDINEKTNCWPEKFEKGIKGRNNRSMGLFLNLKLPFYFQLKQKVLPVIFSPLNFKNCVYYKP